MFQQTNLNKDERFSNNTGDITYAETSKHWIHELEKKVLELWKKRELKVKTGKTERFVIPKPPPPPKNDKYH